MMKTKYILSAFAAGILSLGMMSCDDDDLSSTSVFPDVDDTLDPDSYTYKFDKWLDIEYGEKYNCEFRYQMQHISTDMDYNLVPATYQNAVDMALLVKYLWYDVYAEVTGDPLFLKQYGPKILHLIGSPAFNPANHTEILGLAEGGLKVSLFKVNEMNVDNPELLNEHYFKTMHHEFSHILHQTKTYPVEFSQLNAGAYEPGSWQDRNGAMVNSIGFVTTYASSQAREDFAEICANFITRTYDQWELLLWLAERGWDKVLDDDYAYAYYYYASDSDRENDRKSYVGCYVSPESNQGVFGISSGTGTPNADGDYENRAGSQIFTTVAEVENFIKNYKFELTPVTDLDGNNGREIIEKKVSIARNWFADVWGLDLDALREEVQTRQATLTQPGTIEALRAQIDAVE